MSSVIVLGIIGLPNAGKSTLFSMISGIDEGTSEHPFSTIRPRRSFIEIPDPLATKVAKQMQLQSVAPLGAEFVDVGGLVEGSSSGKGIGNQFLNVIRNADILVQVLNCYDPEAEVSPQRAVEIVDQELRDADLAIIEKALKDLDKRVEKHRDSVLALSNPMDEDLDSMLLLRPLLDGIRNTLKSGRNPYWEIIQSEVASAKLSEWHRLFKIVPQLLSIKHRYYVCNGDTDSDDIEVGSSACSVITCFNLIEEERVPFLHAFFSRTNFQSMGLGRFFTIEGEQVQSWFFYQGADVLEASGIIHPDIMKNFIKAEVYPWKAVERHYKVSDGDILRFVFSK
ncbi:MAG: DUF933 domain-containing protein [Oligoflexia bacterium]|nr:DUF933 domain-containing protein [Oligoflexia bacterium]MBF0367319.1 DUF933 domain-containing protein [Oligoflexia bacterium]